MTLPIEQILLTDIRPDGTQTRVKVDEETLHQYADDYRNGVELPPIDLFYDGNEYWIGDGYHRYFGAQSLPLEYISAVVREGTQRDALRFSLAANREHGLKRSTEDKRKSVSIALDDAEWGEMSNRAIAEICGVSDNFVGQVRSTHQLRTVRSSNGEEERVGKDGKARKLPTKRKSKPVIETPESHPESFEPEKLDATPSKNGKEQVKPADRKEALQLFGKLVRLLDRMRLSADLDQPLKTILDTIKHS